MAKVITEATQQEEKDEAFVLEMVEATLRDEIAWVSDVDAYKDWTIKTIPREVLAQLHQHEPQFTGMTVEEIEESIREQNNVFSVKDTPDQLKWLGMMYFIQQVQNTKEGFTAQYQGKFYHLYRLKDPPNPLRSARLDEIDEYGQVIHSFSESRAIESLYTVAELAKQKKDIDAFNRFTHSITESQKRWRGPGQGNPPANSVNPRPPEKKE